MKKGCYYNILLKLRIVEITNNAICSSRFFDADKTNFTRNRNVVRILVPNNPMFCQPTHNQFNKTKI